jgi:hypothetical protein
MKNAVFWDVAPGRSSVTWHFGRTYCLHLHSLTHLWSWALLEKLPIVQPLKNFPVSYGTWRFITVFTRALHWSLSWARSIQSIPSHPVSLFRVEKSTSEEPVAAGGCSSHWFLTRRFFYPEDGGDMFLWNVSSHKIYTAPHPRRRHSSMAIQFCLIWRVCGLPGCNPM